MNTDAIVLFSGPAGSSLGLRQAGVDRIIGVEVDKEAAATARKAGFNVIESDVRTLDPLDVHLHLLDGLDSHEPAGRRLILQASPPCPGFSTAGKGAGRADLETLLEAIDRLITQATSGRGWSEFQISAEDEIRKAHDTCVDERSPLVLEVLRWVFTLAPDAIMLEQVPAVQPVWDKMAELFRLTGWAVTTSVMHAEQYGVPQSRSRAMLLAVPRIDSDTMPEPKPTHSKYYPRTPDKLDEDVQPWVSMADALDWQPDDMIGFPRKADGAGETITMNGVDYRTRDLRPASKPAFVVTEKGRSWRRYPATALFGDVIRANGSVRPLGRPAPTLTASADNGNFRFVADDTRESAINGERITVEEIGVLQSFPPDHPWQGTRTEQFRQAGNAVPPTLQRALTIHVLECVSEWRESLPVEELC